MRDCGNCGHDEKSHQHYRSGTQCAACNCEGFRTVNRRKVLMWVATIVLVIIGIAATIGSIVNAQTSNPTTTAPPDTHNTSVKIADNGYYGTFLDSHTLDTGQIIQCLITRNNTSMSLSCDWPGPQ